MRVGVIPAHAGIQFFGTLLKRLDPGMRRDDTVGFDWFLLDRRKGEDRSNAPNLSSLSRRERVGVRVRASRCNPILRESFVAVPDSQPHPAHRATCLGSHACMRVCVRKLTASLLESLAHPGGKREKLALLEILKL